MDSLEVRVERGAAYLDGEVPGWTAKIDLDRLDMNQGWFIEDSDRCGCVLAQLDFYERGKGHGHYLGWIDRRQLAGEEEEGLGFSPIIGLKEDDDGKTWGEEADRLWTAQIEKRLEGAEDE